MKNKWLVLGALLLAAPAGAQEFQIGGLIARTNLEIDADSLTSGSAIDADLATFGITFSYRWANGPFAEFGYAASDNFDFFTITVLRQTWVSAGWEFVHGKWRVTPRAGLVRSSLEASELDFFDSEPVDHLVDIVPFIEGSVERRVGRFGLGFFGRANFEDFGSSTTWGLRLGWTFR